MKQAVFIKKKINPLEFARKVISKRGKRIYNRLSKIKKIHQEKQKEKWAKQA